MPQEQRQMTYMMMIVSPIMIIWISLSSASLLGLYWSVSGILGCSNILRQYVL